MRPRNVVLFALALAGCAHQAPTTTPPSSPSAAATEPTEAPQAVGPHIVVLANGTITIAGEMIAGPDEAVNRLRESFDAELHIEDRSGGGTELMTLVSELRKAGATRVVVHFEKGSPSDPSDPPAGPTPSDPPQSREGSLPEITVRNVGLHIGGGPNDEETKAPFKAAVARHFDDLRACYRLVSKPGDGGDFGVDLRIPGKGGKPQVQSQRTGMGGKAFRDCVVDVFANVEFDPPPRGATVISYSVRFALDD